MIKNITEDAHRLEWESYIGFRGCEVVISTEEIVSLAEKHIPHVLENIKVGLETIKVGLEVYDNKPDLLLDKLGVDFLILHNGKRYAIDVTTAKRDSVISKLNKMGERLDFFKALDATPVVVRSPDGIFPSNIMSLILDSKSRNGVVDCRLDKKLCLIT